MNEKTLLVSTIPFEIKKDLNESVRESLSGGKTLVRGIIQRANTKNQNGRIYPKDVLAPQVEKYINEHVKMRNALGELDHSERSQVELKTVSHNIVEMHWEDDDLVGTIEVLPTPCGNILKELLNSNITIGISSRGLGSVIHDNRDDADIVQDDFDLICWDMVSTPSTQGAFVKLTAKLSESVELNNKSGIIPIYTEIDNIVRDILMDI